MLLGVVLLQWNVRSSISPLLIWSHHMLGRRLVDVPPELLSEYYAGSRRRHKHLGDTLRRVDWRRHLAADEVCVAGTFRALSAN
jgi:hypothetical protein